MNEPRPWTTQDEIDFINELPGDVIPAYVRSLDSRMFNEHLDEWAIRQAAQERLEQ